MTASQNTLICSLGIVAGLFAISPAMAATAPPQAAVCASCHGANGLGKQGDNYPALAGLPAAYIEHQLYDFKHGSRENPIMSGLANGLNAQSRAAIAKYYASLPVPVKPELKPLPGGAGAMLAHNGAWHGSTIQGLPACTSCHGANGLGVGTQFPRLAGQPDKYIAAQLNDWKTGSRKNGPLGLMQSVARKLSPVEMQAVAAYYAALSANPPATTAGAAK
jgi:cytochrome c553